MKLPRSVSRLVDSFERLPGIGPRTAQRLTFYLLRVPQELLDEFGEAVRDLKKQTVTCSLCYNVAEEDPCPICRDQNRNHGQILVVEEPLDILALEKTGRYKGVYHVLGGVIDPLNNIGPDEIRIKELLARISGIKHSGSAVISEIVLATDPDMEGEATAMFIANELRRRKGSEAQGYRVTRLGRGLPTGGDLEYADEVTLTQAIEGRREY